MKRRPKLIQDMYKASELLGLQFSSNSRFIDTAIDFLSHHLRDLHMEFHEYEGWAISCCYEEDSWKGWKKGDTLEAALVKAVIAVAKKQPKQPEHGG